MSSFDTYIIWTRVIYVRCLHKYLVHHIDQWMSSRIPHVVAKVQGLVKEKWSISVRFLVQCDIYVHALDWHIVKFPNHIEGSHAPSNELHLAAAEVRNRVVK